MALENDFRTWLLRQPPVKEAVEDRVFAVRFMQGEKTPAIVVSLVSSNPVMSTHGYSGLTFQRVQLDFYSKDYDELTALARAVFDAMVGFTGKMEATEVQHVHFITARDLDEPDVDLYRRTQDWEFAVGG